MGDVKVKRFLEAILQELLEPIRQRRKELEKDIVAIYDILKEGSDKARAAAADTVEQVKDAMKINYFNDEEFIKSQAQKY